MENSKKLSYKSVVALGFLVYFFSYAMRLDYSASIVAIVSDLKITNTMASAAVTGSFITYGVGQVICGIIGDKVSPTKMISVAMLGTILVNTLVSFSNNIWVITALWCINGVCQAMIWPPLTRFISEQVGSDKYANAVTVAGLSILDMFDFVSNSVIMPIVAFFTCVLVGFVIGPKTISDEVKITDGTFKSEKLFSVMIKWIAPIFILAILAFSVAEGMGWIAV
jgi:sugar phosphate permease